MVAAFCRDHGLFLVADEVYREFVYDGAAFGLGAVARRFRRPRHRRRQPLEALQRLRHPARLARDEERRGLPGGAAHGPGAALATRTRAARGERRGRARQGVLRAGGQRVPGPTGPALRRSHRDPGSLPAQARGCLLLHRPSADRGQRGLRALPPRRVRAPAIDRDGGSGTRLLRHPGPGQRRGADRLRPEEGGPDARLSRSSRPASPPIARRAVSVPSRSLEKACLARSRRPDFFTPVV